jgi:arylsulfatase A-like enzyme
MNNVVCILIDSVIWDSIGTSRTKISTTPFIDSLKGESLTASNLYSYGPYTNAATRSLYTGRRALDDFGYYFQLNTSPTNHYKAFHDNGYETYGFYYPYYIIGRKMRESIDHTIYLGGFVFASEWGGIYKRYVEIKQQRPLDNDELLLLTERTRLLFEVWIDFYEDLLKVEESGFFLKGLVEKVDVPESKRIIEEEYQKFEKDPIAYVNSIIDMGTNHVLADLDKIDINDYIDRNYLNNDIYLRYKDFFDLADKYNKKANRKRLRPSIKRIIKGLSRLVKTRNPKEMMFVANYFLCLNAIPDMKKVSQKPWQDISSARVQLWHAADIIDKRNSNKPYFMSLHFLEPHNHVSFFSFDIQDKQAHKEEFDVLSSFVKELKTDFVGNITYYLSIRYVDFCIEEFCNRLKANGQWDNTTLLLVADHGSSYSFYPLHGAHVNCFDDECYHVPMILRHPRMKGREVNSFYNSKDVLPTLMDVLNLSKPKEMTGVSMLDKAVPTQDYVITEYMGPGCPDMLHKRMWLSIRDKHYVVAYKVSVEEEFEQGELAEVYNLENDPQAYYNVKNRISRSDISYLLELLKIRHGEIKSDVDGFIANLKKETVARV